MNFLDLIRKRKSIRKYAPGTVSREIIGRCLEAARLAPSACNSQPWYFLVVDDEALKCKVGEAAFSGPYSMNAFAKNASALVVVVRAKSKGFARFGGFVRVVQYNLIDIGIACEHFVLQAAEEGVGTCWLGWFDEKAVKKVLGIPKDKKADIMISLGYPEGAVPGERPRKPAEAVGGFNRESVFS